MLASGFLNLSFYLYLSPRLPFFLNSKDINCFNMKKWKKIWNASWNWVLSLHRGYAYLLCILPILMCAAEASTLGYFLNCFVGSNLGELLFHFLGMFVSFWEIVWQWAWNDTLFTPKHCQYFFPWLWLKKIGCFKWMLSGSHKWINGLITIYALIFFFSQSLQRCYKTLIKVDHMISFGGHLCHSNLSLRKYTYVLFLIG